MKIIYSFNIESVNRDLQGVKNYPLTSYSKFEILNGIGSSYIILIFDYWNQEIVVVEDAILSFFYNFTLSLDELKSCKIDKAHVFSTEQGFHMKLHRDADNVVIQIFEKKITINLSEILKASLKTSKFALEDMARLYPGLSENKYFIEIKDKLK